MNSSSKIIFIVIGIVIGITLFISIGFNNVNKDSSKTETTKNISKPDTSYSKFVQDNYKIFSIPLPNEVAFANEQAPITNIDVAERLDREIMVNTFWHSQTFLLIKRANRWFPVIEPILKKNNIPDDFKYLAVIESGLDNVTSPSGAKGFWQFMESTATGYGLETNENVDERYHLEKATETACQYLNSSYGIFNNWTLAAASYNMGKSGLQNVLNQQQSDNYYDLLLNIETGRYIYRIIAAKCILSNPELYGFNLRQEDLYTPYKTHSIEVDSTVNDLTEFAFLHQTNYKTLKLLNPWLRSNTLPQKENKTYSILLPDENANLNPVSIRKQ